MRRRRGPFRRRGHRGPPLGHPGRRIFRRGSRRNALPPKVHADLRRANRLSEQGDHINAGVIFERLAEQALDRDLLRHAPMLFLQAAHAYVLAGEVEKGIDLARKGLGILADAQRWGKLNTAGQRVVETLATNGYSKESDEIQDWLNEIRGGHSSGGSSYEKSRGQLPPKCPFCGATVRSDEVSWIDKNSAECTYCGSAVPTSG